jgi:hypothetical protein
VYGTIAGGSTRINVFKIKESHFSYVDIFFIFELFVSRWWFSFASVR